MSRSTRITIAKPDIVTHFNALRKNIYTKDELGIMLRKNRDNWRLTQSMTLDDFIGFLIKKTQLKKHVFIFPSYTITRHNWFRATDLEIVCSIKANSYFSHYTAAFLHELTNKVPKTFYLTREQSAKKKREKPITQNEIDEAFSKISKHSSNMAKFGDNRVYLLHGMFTGNIGVKKDFGPNGQEIYYTTLERTLIDMVVRPQYSGGVHEVLEAFRLARGRLSINNMLDILSKMDFVYPYRQAIGFFLEKAGGYSKRVVRHFRPLNEGYIFYLDHAMKEPDFSEEWKLFYPKGF